MSAQGKGLFVGLSSGGSKDQVGSTAEEIPPFTASLELIRNEFSSVQNEYEYLNIHQHKSTAVEGPRVGLSG